MSYIIKGVCKFLFCKLIIKFCGDLAEVPGSPNVLSCSSALLQRIRALDHPYPKITSELKFINKVQ